MPSYFSHFDKPKTGENIGEKLEDACTSVGCCPDYIGSHAVDEATNARSSVECLEWQTSDKHSQMIVASPCDAHNRNRSASIASGTSANVTFLNPELDRALTVLHNSG